MYLVGFKNNYSWLYEGDDGGDVRALRVFRAYSSKKNARKGIKLVHKTEEQTGTMVVYKLVPIEEVNLKEDKCQS
jgi:pyruvate/oxaloacetate carboxyltransferase